MTVLYKAVRPDGTDFRTGRIHYLADGIGTVVRHHDPHYGDPSGYFSTSTSPADCTGMSWPCRLLVVEPVDCEPVAVGGSLLSLRAVTGLRVVAERPAHEALGPQGEHVAALIERAASLTTTEVGGLAAAWAEAWAAAWTAAGGAVGDAAWVAAWAAAWAADRVAVGDACRAAAWAAAWDAARDAARAAARDADRDADRVAARDAAWDAAGAAAGDAAVGLVVRDLIPTETYDVLTLPWRRAVGRIHPDDPEATQ